LLVEAFRAAWTSGAPSLRGAAVLQSELIPAARLSTAALGLRDRPDGSVLRVQSRVNAICASYRRPAPAKLT
jgi:hypothetical protein